MSDPAAEPPREKPPEDVGRRFSRLARTDTGPEMLLRRHLHALGLRYRVHERIEGLPRKRVDVVFSKVKLAVFVDGCFWHACPEHAHLPASNREWWIWKFDVNRKRDNETDVLLRRLGWTPHRVWEHEDMATAAIRIRELAKALRKDGRQSAPSSRD